MSEKKIDSDEVLFRFESHGDTHIYAQPALTYRRWLAGIAMQGILAHACINHESAFKDPKGLAKQSYRCADAMITFETQEAPK